MIVSLIHNVKNEALQVCTHSILSRDHLLTAQPQVPFHPHPNMMASSPTTTAFSLEPLPLPAGSSKRRRPPRNSLPPADDHTSAHANASLTDESALDHLMSALHLDHSNSNLPPLYPTATPHAVRAHLAAMGYDQVPQDTLAAIVNDLNAGQVWSKSMTNTTETDGSSRSNRRRRKRAQVTIHDESYLSTMHEPSGDEQVVDLTTLNDLSLSTAAAAAISIDSRAGADATEATTLTRPELETYLLDMGYAPSDLDTALVDDLLEALNESVAMGQETMMSMMRDQAEEQRAGEYTGTVMTGNADRTVDELQSSRHYRPANEVHWEMETSREQLEEDDKVDTTGEQGQREQTNASQEASSQRSWSPAPSAASTYSSSSHARAYKPATAYSSSSTFRGAFRAPPPSTPRTPANDPVLRYQQYARAWSNSPFLVRREREAGNAGASVWSLPSSTAAAAAAGGSTLMSHSRTSGAGRPAIRPTSKWDDTFDQSDAGSAGTGGVDKDRDVWAVRDWIKAPGSGTSTGARTTSSLNR
ncbi:hypothetical protein BCR44DRAFT_70013 [Catenaria anguillulae PL171]|uniref:Uncharacterized protein n=1 Tax=Catenaria anguillulae PL171 TaxID=765915 RepID=A0A1Y2I6T4_9FUNG|nr:hypothetical protein BCR44DRAFT_70013 [Catenaria anguillulae PL171]